MIENIYRIADKNILISSMHESVHSLCKDYRVNSSDRIDVDFEVKTNQNDIDYEREKNTEGEHSDGYLETLAVYRKIAEKMIEFDTFLFHGSCIAIDGQGILFTAKSGVGKSTHAKNWCDLFSGRVLMVNDDKPLIHVGDNHVTIYGTPYNGKHKRGSDISVPLKAICVLERDEQNSIKNITYKDAFPTLIQQIYRPEHKEAYAHTIKLIEKMSKQLNYYNLHCNMDIESARVAYEGIMK
ncbi:hypothetical protein [Ruminococcus sp.]|jgi:hypothetical protein|uniref:hypothetical protein n=1 Tax=Ruminococcus sp. TaxID=41978 RepID=UPI0025DE956E|nr:hypothetical protein [Ruminococcus sp.]